jgi:hypothetical protein
MRDAPLSFVLTLTSALSDAAIDAMISDPAAAKALGDIAFDAFWRVIG